MGEGEAGYAAQWRIFDAWAAAHLTPEQVQLHAVHPTPLGLVLLLYCAMHSGGATLRAAQTENAR